MWYSVSLPTEDWELYWHERLAGIACQGVDDSSIAEIVNAQMVEHLPRSFDAFLRLAGTSCGRLWVGSDTSYPRLLTLKQSALSLTAEVEVEIPALDNGSVVFLMHQGYVFLYISAVGEDPPVMQFREDSVEPTQIAQSFSQFVLASIANLQST